jgi:hypothetical protein
MGRMEREGKRRRELLEKSCLWVGGVVVVKLAVSGSR